MMTFQFKVKHTLNLTAVREKCVASCTLEFPEGMEWHTHRMTGYFAGSTWRDVGNQVEQFYQECIAFAKDMAQTYQDLNQIPADSVRDIVIA
jgi:hypothetical protein